VINISIGTGYVSIDLAIRDDDLLDIFLDGLEKYVTSGQQIKILQTYASAPTESKRIVTKIISRLSHIDEWKSELKQLLYVQRKADI
jgi:hypothetical protein